MIRIKNKSDVNGKISWKLIHQDGTVEEGSNHNIVVTEGDNYVADAMLKSGSTKTAMKGIALCTGFSSESKDKTWVVTGYTGNYKAFDATYPKLKSGTPGTVQYQVTFSPGEATQISTPIDEAVITNVSANTNGTHPTSSDILAYAEVTPFLLKSATDTLIVVWEISVLG